MDIEERKEVTRIESIVVAKKCDICGKDIKQWNHGSGDVYFEVMTGHNDFGRDSVDSIIHRDACSVSCLKKMLDGYYLDKSYTSYFEIRRERWTAHSAKG